MTLTTINELLATLNEKKRENVFAFASALMEWMQVELVAKEKPPLLSPSTQKLMGFLVPAPFTVQPQLYRLSNDNQNIMIRFGVLKKLKKDYISQLVDNDPGLTSFQASMRGIINLPGREPYIASQPYFIHFVTTGAYDRLLVIINQGEQKRIIQFKGKLSNTQFNKILPQWQNIGTKPKTEITNCIWKSLDVKEVNKDFYKCIKERFDAAIGIAKAQYPKAKEQDVKQFAVRLIGRYIFCWFLKEKEIIPANLLSSETIRKYQQNYFQTYLFNLYFNTLNEEVQSRKTFTTGSELDAFYLNIPYLNGGLFDTHPEDELFDKIDLNAWLINFVEILESFDFTVDESSSQYQLVAIDPEMLGRIFENLLASQNQETEKLANQRKAFGAFYTPREIVDYMVNESLKAHLETHLLPKDEVESSNIMQEPLVAYKGSLFAHLEPQQTLMNLSSAVDFDKERKRERLTTKIEKLFAPECSDNPFDKTETQQVRKALSEIKVLDPACGSGAFPMGMLLRLMELRHIVGHGHKNNYELKSEILSKNIYGVDIMPMAVEIARLRAWLSLVLEADYKPTDRKNNFGVSALPNLDFKFVCANSLIDSGYDAFLKHVEHNATLMRLDGEIQKLENIRDTYFDPKGDKLKKEELQKQFIETKNYIKTEFKSLRKTWNLDDFLNKVDDWNPFDDSHPSSFFSPAWMFGIKEGFDVVIGNPPYGVSVKGNYRKAVVESLGKVPDYEIYHYFIELAKRWTRNDTHCSYIIPNSILFNVFASNYRKALLEKWNIKEILDCTNFDIFEGATVRNIIFLFNSNGPSKIVGYRNNIGANTFNELISNPRINLSANDLLFFNQNWGLAFKLEKVIIELITKIKKKTKPLNYYFPEISQGLIAYDKYQGQDEETIKNRIYHFTEKKRKNLKSWLWGEDVTKYNLKWNQKEWIDYSSGIANPRKKEFFTAKRVLIREITNPSIFAAYTEEEYYNDPAIINILEGKEIELLSILAILNSKLASFLHFNNSPKATKGAFPKILVDDLKQFPISNSLLQVQEQFIAIVEKILSLKKQNQDTTSLEKEIDVMVYKLYELTYDEVKIIDKDFWLSEEEYINFNM